MLTQHRTIEAGAEPPAFELHKFHKFEFIERFDEKVEPRSNSNPYSVAAPDVTPILLPYSVKPCRHLFKNTDGTD